MEESTARRLLEQERARLLEIKERQSSEQFGLSGEEGTAESDQMGADAAMGTFDRTLNQSIVDHAEAELEEVDAALRRLDDATYGVCEETGAPIPDERLEAMPATRYSVEGQEVVERRRGVGERGTGDPTATTNTRRST